METETKTMTLDEALEGCFVFDEQLPALCYEKRGARRFALVYGDDRTPASWDVECYEFELRALGLVRREALFAAESNVRCFHPPLTPVRPERWPSGFPKVILEERHTT